MPTDKPPNILWIMTDQHRWDCLGCYGHREVRTPTLDALREEGILFCNAYTPSPVCGPARAALFSGCFPPRSGVTVNWAPFNGRRILLPEFLKHGGYATSCVGKLHFVPHLKTWGFDEKLLHDLPNNVFADDAKYSDYVRWLRTQVPDKVDEWIARYDEDELQEEGDFRRYLLGSNHVPEDLHMVTWTAARSREMLSRVGAGDRPFFHYVSFIGPHHPFAVPSPWQGRHSAETVSLPEHFARRLEDCPIWRHQREAKVRKIDGALGEKGYREAIAAYYDHVEMLDHAIGAILEELRADGRWDDTMIVFTSDHGEHCGQYGAFFKGDMYESSCKVPLLVKLPGGRHKGRTVRRACSILDLFGTMLDAAGGGEWREAAMESGSWWDALSSTDEGFDAFVGEPGRAFSLIGRCPDSLCTMVKEGDFKLMRLNRADAEPLYEFHDLRGQSGESRNGIEEEQSQPEIARLRLVLDAWTGEQIRHFPEKEIRLARTLASKK